MYVVYRRYSEFESLHKLLRMEFPTCIIPPIPPKSTISKLKGAESEVNE